MVMWFSNSRNRISKFMFSGGYGTVKMTVWIREIKCYKAKILLVSLGSLMPKTYDRDRFLKLSKHKMESQ